MLTSITIVKKPHPKDPALGYVLQPDTGLPAQVKTGDLITFLLGEGVNGLSITFTDRSPFGTLMTVAYDQPVEVTEAHDPRRSNSYRYSCRTVDGISTDDGGEVEIVHN